MSDPLKATTQRVMEHPAPAAPSPAARRGVSRHPAAEPEATRPSSPSRRGTRLIGGHFRPELARRLRILAAEEDTTVQALLEEAINLLLAQKARRRSVPGGAE